ncbi:MAG TPA: hypothetical protein VFZ09_26360 [Archangium sp.]|uniref:hypothetical protein n=1 Tax=Archangium sp. TaxID=1872627 RepID=UPI002E360F59|nr:hypothetical protein [Archangium sp.]HEX5749782.1 hypothetical protein [Archangium sp.]
MKFRFFTSLAEEYGIGDPAGVLRARIREQGERGAVDVFPVDEPIGTISVPFERIIVDRDP